MSMPLKNVTFGIVMLCIGIAYAFLSSALPDRSVQGVPGPSFFPNIVAGMIIILSSSLLIKGALGLRHEPALPASVSVPIKGTVVILSILVFIVVLPYAGFLVAGIPFFAVLMMMCGKNQRVQIAVGSLVIPVVLYFLFREGFSILLPSGQWM